MQTRALPDLGFIQIFGANAAANTDHATETSLGPSIAACLLAGDPATPISNDFVCRLTELIADSVSRVPLLDSGIQPDNGLKECDLTRREKIR